MAVTLSGRRLRVVHVQDAWRVDDEWWRERPVSRVYFSVALEDGQVVSTFRDMVCPRWSMQ